MGEVGHSADSSILFKLSCLKLNYMTRLYLLGKLVTVIIAFFRAKLRINVGASYKRPLSDRFLSDLSSEVTAKLGGVMNGSIGAASLGLSF